ncbi:hypothetical protein D3C86_779880 [compost metagenome]
MHPARHFNGAAEGDFAIALRKVQIPHRQAAALDVDRKEHAGPARQVLDVAVAAVLAGRHRTCAFGRCAIAVGALQGAHVSRLGRGRIGQRRHAIGVGVDQCLFAPVPRVQQLFVGQAADQAGMNQPREIHARNMARRREHAVEIPNGFLRMREVFGQEAAPIVAAEKAIEPPQAVGLGADIQQVNHQQIAGLRAFHAHRAGKKMHGGQVYVAHIVGAVVVLDRAARPVIGFQYEIVAGLDPHGHRNIRMPAVVDVLVFVRGLVQIDLDEGCGHSLSSPTCVLIKQNFSRKTCARLRCGPGL